jgi:capsule polysaccharide export protein KpsC/LpsZ
LVVVNDNDVKARVVSAITEYFALENWDFGETFYFSELAAYIINQLAPDVSSIVLVPRQESQSFGSLYELKSENDEIFISSATVDDVQIIDSITASRLKATGIVVTSDEVLNTGVQSADTTSTFIITGGSN